LGCFEKEISVKITFSRLSIYRLDSISAYLKLEWSEKVSMEFFQKLNEN
jgi:hypothetical protein